MNIIKGRGSLAECVNCDARSNLSMIVKRLFSSVLIIVSLALAINISWLANIAIMFFAIAALYEFFTMIEKKGIVIFKYFGIGLGFGILLSISMQFELTRGWELLLIIIALLSIILIQFRRCENKGVVVGLSTTMFGLFYIPWFMSFLIKIRYLEYGVGMLATVVLVTKGSDIGAFLLGSRFGQHPLVSRISPNKTREGFLGGIIFSICVALACHLFMPEIFSYLHLALLGFCLGVLAQIGDLSESLMKRDCEVKDSGNMFPGLGGALDCVDSLLFTAPVFYFWVLHFGATG